MGMTSACSATGRDKKTRKAARCIFGPQYHPTVQSAAPLPLPHSIIHTDSRSPRGNCSALHSKHLDADL